ncbi:MAG: hypothetical protein AAF913_14805, partial [Pseudomonadota bacterium]
NNRRLLEPIGNIPPAEAEAAYHARMDAMAAAAQLKPKRLRQTRGGSGSQSGGATGWDVSGRQCFRDA